MQRASLETEGSYVSDEDAAYFLKDLAQLYRDRKLGNTGLAHALERISRSLLREASSHHAKPAKSDLTESGSKNLKDMTLDSVHRYIDNPEITKRQLMEIAYYRFSIPQSQLKRLKIEDVKKSIKTAASNEQSIKIIHQEAENDAKIRNS